MFYTHEKELIYKNIKLLALKGSSDDREYCLKYRRALEIYHKKHIPINYSNDLFIYDDHSSNELAKAYNQGLSLIDDKHQGALIPNSHLSEEDKNFIFNKCQQALDLLKILDSELYALFTFAIHSIFSKKSNKVDGFLCKAASSSNAIGVIFLNCSQKLSIEDILELLVHELTHTIIFIDELSNVQFDYDELIKKEHYSKSAILNSSRPLDKVVHSIIVAAQIIHFRRKYQDNYNISKVFVHPKTEIMLSKTKEAIDELLSTSFINKVMTEHSISLIKETRNSLNKIN